MKAPVLTVTQLNTYAKSLLDADLNLNRVLVCGEISNFTNHYRTGHFYMTLKDADSAIKAVMFRANNQRLRFEPENGMSVLVRGRVSIYERDGQYQLYIDDMQPDGLGSLTLAFEQMKERLAAQGFFSQEHKKPIPRFPGRIAVVTSPTGAAVQDIMNIIRRRFPCVEIVMCPVQVQGPSAAGQIAGAVREVNRRGCADVIIVGRGGGSIEDLWAFNEEIVARAVYDSEIPVISAVGHETDFTICDFVADLRAPTPSAAAELAVPDIIEVRERLRSFASRCSSLISSQIDTRRLELNSLVSSGALRDPTAALDAYRLNLDSMHSRAETAVRSMLDFNRGSLSTQCGKLDAMSPLKVMERGYSVTQSGGKTLFRTSDVSIGDCVSTILPDGVIYGTVTDIIKNEATGE